MSRDSPRPRTTSIENARIVTPESVIADGRVRIEGDRITRVESGGEPEDADRHVDAGGHLLLPGIVDLHGDDLERHLFPRDGASVDPAVALTACDRANVAAGVTTKFNAVAFEEAPGKNRSVETARELVETIPGTGGLLADHRVHGRCELADDGAVDAVTGLVEAGNLDLVSAMNHAPGSGQFADFEAFADRYDSQDVTIQGDGGRPESLRAVGERRRELPVEKAASRLERVATATREWEVPLAAHDTEEASTVRSLADRGVDICEFPTTLAALRRANELGMATAMGAPNLVRGGSLWGNLGVETAIERDGVDVLCSDYHPQSMLQAAFVETGEPLPDRVARVSSAPADAAGLTDRGRITEGARADLVVAGTDPVPSVRRVFVGGEQVYRAAPSGS